MKQNASLQYRYPKQKPCATLQAVELGTAKANLPVFKCFMLSIMGGIFIGFGGALAVSVGPNCPEMAASNPGLLKILTGMPTDATPSSIMNWRGGMHMSSIATEHMSILNAAGSCPCGLVDKRLPCFMPQLTMYAVHFFGVFQDAS